MSQKFLLLVRWLCVENDPMLMVMTPGCAGVPFFTAFLGEVRIQKK